MTTFTTQDRQNAQRDTLSMLDHFAFKSIDYLVRKNTVRDLAEALLICLSQLRNKEGKLIAVQYDIPFEDRVECALQIAEMILNENRSPAPSNAPME